MANLDRDAIKTLIKLSRIDCSQEEQDALLHDLKKILNYVEQLNEVDTDQVPPCNQVLHELANVMREDVVEQAMSREVFLANVPSHVGGLVRVPPVMKTSQTPS